MEWDYQSGIVVLITCVCVCEREREREQRLDDLFSRKPAWDKVVSNLRQVSSGHLCDKI